MTDSWRRKTRGKKTTSSKETGVKKSEAPKPRASESSRKKTPPAKTDLKKEDGPRIVILQKTLEEEGYENLIKGNYKGPTLGIEEVCVANPWDADAGEVYIALDFETRELSCRDNGRGMKRGDENPYADLQAFISTGRPKGFERPKLTEGGRPVIGRFATGTESLFCMCHEYDFTTRRGGTQSLVHDEFKPGELLLPGRDILVAETDISENQHGSELVLRRLKFSTLDLSLEKLKKRIQQDFALSGDFRVWVNNEEIAPFSVPQSKRYVFTKTGKHMGRINGTIYVADREAVDKGFYVRIRTRNHGSAKGLLKEITEGMSIGLQNRLIIEVQAEDLEGAILPDRTSIDHEHPGILELKHVVTEQVKQARTTTGKIRVDRTDALNRNSTRTAGEARVQIVHAGIDSNETQVEFLKTPDPTAPAVTYDPATLTYVFNMGNPLLVITPDINASLLRRNMVLAMCEARAREKTGEAEEQRVLRDGYLSKLADAALAKKPPVPKINPSRVYQPHELTSQGRKQKTIEQMIATGVFPSEHDGGVIGEEYVKKEAELSGLVGINDFTVASTAGGSQLHYEEQACKFFENAGDLQHPFAYNLSQTDAPCWVVEGACQTLLFQALRRYTRRSKHPKNPASLLTEIGNTMLTMTEIGVSLDDCSTTRATRVRDYAKQENISIKTGKVRGQGEKAKQLTTYRLGDFVHAMQAHRGNTCTVPYKPSA